MRVYTHLALGDKASVVFVKVTVTALHTDAMALRKHDTLNMY